MKKILTLTFCLINFGVYSAGKDLTFYRYQMNQSAQIVDEFKAGTTTKNEFIGKLDGCSSKRNIFCTLYLSSIYLEDKSYSKSRPLLHQLATYNSESNDDVSIKIRTSSNYTLGENYAFGQGVLQDFDIALKYYGLAAKNGDKDSIIRISQLFLNKASTSINNKYKSDFIIKAYAYMKVAQSLPGKIEIHEGNGKTVSPIETIIEMQGLDYFKPYLKEADFFARKLCSTIKGCQQ
tara:strand:+ start:1166 stop:1870 length:705 start_codon:yes stop_codon:yes gene_type:complete